MTGAAAASAGALLLLCAVSGAHAFQVPSPPRTVGRLRLPQGRHGLLGPRPGFRVGVARVWVACTARHDASTALAARSQINVAQRGLLVLTTVGAMWRAALLLDPWAWYRASIAAHPIATDVGTAIVLYVLGKVTSDRINKQPWAQKRVYVRWGIMGLLDGLFTGMWYRWLQVHVACPAENAGLLMAAVSTGLYTPVFSGGFIFTNAALSGSGLRDSVSAVRRDFRALTVAGIRTWGPMNVALFTFIPAHLRVAFSMVVHYFYIVMLATWMSGFLGRFMATCDEFRQLVTDAVTGRGGKTGSNTVDATTADATTAAPVASPSAAMAATATLAAAITGCDVATVAATVTAATFTSTATSAAAGVLSDGDGDLLNDGDSLKSDGVTDLILPDGIVAAAAAAASVTGLTGTDGLEAGEAPFTRGAYSERDVVNDVAGQIVTESGSPGVAGDKEQLL